MKAIGPRARGETSAILMWPEHVSNVAGMAHIAAQRNSASVDAPPMNDRTHGLPPDAEQISSGGFNKYVGPLFRLSDDGPGGQTKRYCFIAREQHMNGAGTIHGGMLMTFMDVAMSRTSRVTTGAKSLSTVSLNCDFVGPGRLSDVIEARVRVARATRTLVFMSGEIVADERTLLIATGLWRIVM